MPDLRAWVTPSSIPGTTVCRPLFIPNDPALLAAVSGALLPLGYATNWQEIDGATPEDTAAAMQSMLQQFWAEGGCGVPIEIDRFVHEEPQGINGGGVTANVNFVFPYTASDAYNAGKVIRSGSNFIVSPGLYHFRFEHIMRASSAVFQKSWMADTDLVAEVVGLTYNSPANVQALQVVTGFVQAIAERVIVHVGRSSVTRAGDALGLAMNVAGIPEVYGMVEFQRIGDV